MQFQKKEETMDKHLPKISICIPNYNNGKYLNSCLQSAIQQNYENKEIIFVDDQSTDNSLEIATRYKNQINVYQNESNLGQPKNTNKSLSLATGEYVVILHSDDKLLPDFSKKLSAILNAHADVGLAVGERIETDHTDTYEHIPSFYNQNCIIEGEKQAKVFLFTSFLPCQVLFRKDLFFSSGEVDERHIVNLDGLLWFRMSLNTKVGYIQDEVCIYRRHHENTTAMYNRSINHMMEYYSTLSEMFKIGKNNSYLTQFFDDAEKRVASLTVRYCQDVMKNKDYPLAQRYLRLAVVFSEQIQDDPMFKIISKCLASKEEDKLSLYYALTKNLDVKRTVSYDPPEGSIQMKRD